MSYLVCDTCDGYYELQEGESPEKFIDTCECGGKLKYVQNINQNGDIKSNHSIKVKICPVCNGKNSETSKICAICGKKLEDIPNSRKSTPNPEFNDPNLKPFTTRFMELLNWKAIAAGCIVFIAVFITDSLLIGAPKFFYASINLIYLEALIGGFAAGYVADPEYRTGLFNGVLYGLIAAILLLTLIIVGIGAFLYIQFFTVSMMISGSFGALIGTTFQKLIITAKGGSKKDFLVCKKCGGYYELLHGESPETLADKCECGGTLNHVQYLDNADEIQINKIVSKFRFHPVISIALGAVTTFILFGSLEAVFETGTSASIIALYATLVLGGFIATYFSKEKKVLYGAYTGACLFAANIFIVSVYDGSVNIEYITAVFTILLFTSIGGFIGAAVDNHLENTGKEIV